jgi:hypothetical protein
MTPLERRTSGLVMRAGAKVDEFPLLLPEEPELDSEAEAESVDDSDSDDDSEDESDDESVEEELDEPELLPPPPEDEFELPPTDTNVPVELVLKLNGWPGAEKKVLELSLVKYTVLPLINYLKGEV